MRLESIRRPQSLVSGSMSFAYGMQDEQWRKLDRVVQTAKEIWR